MRSRTDTELLETAGSDPSAFAAFYDRYEGPVVAYFARRVKDPELVADLTAEVFAAALRAASRYRELEPSAAGWLFTIAHNTLAVVRLPTPNSRFDPFQSATVRMTWFSPRGAVIRSVETAMRQ